MHESFGQFNRVLNWFETLTPETLSQIDSIYSVDACFRDPFNNLVGLTGISKVYQHMFDTLQTPRFKITHAVVHNEQAFATWDFDFGLSGRSLQIQGCTHFVLNTEGRITIHRDYWDAAEELYEKFPVLGSLMRILKRKLATKL
jgi:hypothetical protein